MIIPDWMIFQLCQGNVPDRIKQIIYVDTSVDNGLPLRIKPLVDPVDVNTITCHQVGLRVGNTAKLHLGVREYNPIDLSQHTKDNPYLLQPNGLVVLQTKESINLPSYLISDVDLEHERWEDGYHYHWSNYRGTQDNKLVMAISNRTVKELPLYPDLSIAQISFYLMLAKPANESQ